MLLLFVYLKNMGDKLVQKTEQMKVTGKEKERLSDKQSHLNINAKQFMQMFIRSIY